jgi:hypothetical protein
VAARLRDVALIFVAAGFLVPAVAKEKVPIPRAAPRTETGAPVHAAAGSLPAAADVPASGSGDGIGTDDPNAVVDDAGAGVETLDGSVDAGGAVTDPGGDQPMELAPAEKTSRPDGNGPLDLTVAPKGGVADTPPPPADGPPGSFALEARLTEVSPPITAGLTWRIFDAAPSPDGKLKLVGEAHGGSVKLILRSGSYFIHAAYGRAGAMKKITVSATPGSDSVVLNAGGMRLVAFVGKDQPLAPTDVTFDIYAPSEDGSDERAILVANAPAGRIIGLNAGTYHVVSRYGDANAVVRADIRIEAGKLTEATVYQKAARLTLKLVGEQGGEAIANTAWSVVSPSGETISDSVGAFPSVVLATGDYTAIAKHEGKIYERNFTVEAGLNRDIEVIAK